MYGTSVDEESCISPTDAQQWMYDRNRGQQSIASFITNNHDIKEETDEDTESMADELHSKLRRDSDVTTHTFSDAFHAFYGVNLFTNPFKFQIYRISKCQTSMRTIKYCLNRVWTKYEMSLVTRYQRGNSLKQSSNMNSTVLNH